MLQLQQRPRLQKVCLANTEAMPETNQASLRFQAIPRLPLSALKRLRITTAVVLRWESETLTMGKVMCRALVRQEWLHSLIKELLKKALLFK